MGEAYPKKSANPVNVTLLFTLVLGLITSTTVFNLGIVSKNFLILEKLSCGKFSKNSFISSFVKSFDEYILYKSTRLRHSIELLHNEKSYN